MSGGATKLRRCFRRVKKIAKTGDALFLMRKQEEVATTFKHFQSRIRDGRIQDLAINQWDDLIIIPIMISTSFSKRVVLANWSSPAWQSAGRNSHGGRVVSSARYGQSYDLLSGSNHRTVS